MRTRRLFPALLAAALLLACGEGRAIFNVDVLSFIQGEGQDTLHYTIPGGTAGNADAPAVEVSMLGLAADQLDSVIVTMAADVENVTGAGTIAFAIYFGPDSATVYAPANLYTADTVAVSGADTAAVTPPPVALVGDTLFANSTIWVGVRAGIAANPGPPLDGKVRLTVLNLRIVADVSSNP